MEQTNQNSDAYEAIQLKLLQHIENRQKIKQVYAKKGIQMLQKQELILSDIKEPELIPTYNNVYKSMKSELSQKGYDEFRFLGQGAQGLVVLVKEKSTNKRYAIKGIHFRDSDGNLNQAIYDQAQQEIKMLNQCKGSPYVVNLLQQIEGNEFIFLVFTECLGTLNEIIKKIQNQRLNELSAIKYAKEIAEGLNFIHSNNCLVNDLKMDNILIDYNGNAVVCDFGLADAITQYSGHAMGQYKGNFQYQAPECYDSQSFDIYSKEYIKLKEVVKQEPSPRSEACSLGYLIYTMIQGDSQHLLFNKHKPLQYDADFQNFSYQKELRQIIDGLTKFIPRERLEIKDVLIILKGITSLELDLDSKFNEVMDDSAAQQYINSFTKEVEYVQGIENKFYPIGNLDQFRKKSLPVKVMQRTRNTLSKYSHLSVVFIAFIVIVLAQIDINLTGKNQGFSSNNEKELAQFLNLQIDEQKYKHEEVIEEQNKKIKGIEQLVNYLLNQQETQENQKYNIQSFIQNQKAHSQQIITEQPDLSQQDQFQKQKTEKNQETQNYQQNQMEIQFDQQTSGQSTKKYLNDLCQ